jgi:hypothetical protein
MDMMDLVFLGAIAALWLVTCASVVGCVKLGDRP